MTSTEREPRPLRLYDTYTRKLEELRPLHPPEVRLYTCGPTVHDYAHIGNFRTYVFEDVLRRYLRYKGFQVVQVMNITDVEDKIIAKANAQGVTIATYTERFTRAFFEDLATLRIEPAEHYPCATGYVPEMIALIERLTERGITYVSEGSVYFRIASFPAYGRLSGIDPAEVRPGARVDVDEYDKEDARDFVLWKAARAGEPAWDSPWGPGRPGWHIECSAMSMKLLGEEFDIHTGGADNVFPHHENEIAQSVMATGKAFARRWVHSEWLLVDGEKMSKSKGNFYTVRDVIARGVAPLALRMLLVQHHYKTPLNFTFESLAHAAAGLERLRTTVNRLHDEPAAGSEDLASDLSVAERGFEEAMDEDLNTNAAMAALFTLAHRLHTAMDRHELSAAGRAAALALIGRLDTVVGLLEREEVELPAPLAEMCAARYGARKERNWAESDRLRDALAEAGVAVEDTRVGMRLTFEGKPVRWNPPGD